MGPPVGCNATWHVPVPCKVAEHLSCVFSRQWHLSSTNRDSCQHACHTVSNLSGPTFSLRSSKSAAHLSVNRSQDHTWQGMVAMPCPAATPVSRTGCSVNEKMDSDRLDAGHKMTSLRRASAQHGPEYGDDEEEEEEEVSMDGGDGYEQGDAQWTPPDFSGVDVEDLAEKLLQQESAQAMLKDLAAAQERVEAARRAMDEIERREMAAAAAQARIDDILSTTQRELEDADRTLSELERDVDEAEAQMAAAERALVEARAGGSVPHAKWSNPEVDEKSERFESGKTAAVAAVAGLITSLPFILNADLPLLSTVFAEAVAVVSCALFGITYRYAVRRDVGNVDLKAGAVGAFGLVRGLAQIDIAQLSSTLQMQQTEAFQRGLIKSGVDVAESVMLMAFTAAAIEFCQRSGFVQPFPSRRSSKQDS